MGMNIPPSYINALSNIVQNYLQHGAQTSFSNSGNNNQLTLEQQSTVSNIFNNGSQDQFVENNTLHLIQKGDGTNQIDSYSNGNTIYADWLNGKAIFNLYGNHNSIKADGTNAKKTFNFRSKTGIGNTGTIIGSNNPLSNSPFTPTNVYGFSDGQGKWTISGGENVRNSIDVFSSTSQYKYTTGKGNDFLGVRGRSNTIDFSMSDGIDQVLFWSDISNPNFFHPSNGNIVKGSMGLGDDVVDIWCNTGKANIKLDEGNDRVLLANNLGNKPKGNIMSYYGGQGNDTFTVQNFNPDTSNFYLEAATGAHVWEDTDGNIIKLYDFEKIATPEGTFDIPQFIADNPLQSPNSESKNKLGSPVKSASSDTGRKYVPIDAEHPFGVPAGKGRS